MTDSIPAPRPIVCFYVHHHGAGHVMRAISIAKSLEGVSMIFMGSNLKPHLHRIPETVSCVHLPEDVPADDELAYADQPLSFLHYAPIRLRGQRERTAMITNTLNSPAPMVLIVDVSVEVTLLARLCGVPTVVIRQHGDRNDLAHLQAYESAALLIAPFSKAMQPPSALAWVNEKTMYAGGFSKYSSLTTDTNQKEKSNHVAILIGEGGTSINSRLITHLAEFCRDYHFQVIGMDKPLDEQAHPGITWQGKLADPAELLASCAVVIGNAGHNTVMEMADLNKRFICLPEERPFNEQRQKANLLALNSNASVIYPEDLDTVDWKEEVRKQQATIPQWNNLTNPEALRHITTAIKQILNT
jgi:predicted glycosyltransferase